MPSAFGAVTSPTIVVEKSLDVPLPTEEILNLRLDKQAELLDAIDALRRARLSNATIDTPQIVVCGEQSSGKSSLLQAIANVPFPVSDGTTTRFATELILRRSDQLTSSHRNNVSIVPASDRTHDQVEQLRAFEYTLEDLDNVGHAIGAALDHLKKVIPGEKLFQDRLRLEICGPDQPHLTLVDLPGLVHSDVGRDIRPGDRDKIKDLLKDYIRNPRAILILVYNAQDDDAKQEILNFFFSGAESNDASTVLEAAKRDVRQRTLGVVTKVDVDPNDGGRRRNIISMVNNKQTHLKLGFGWHVVKNLRHYDEDQSMEHRNESERVFFSGPEWSALRLEDLGITTLVEKLKRHLMDCIISNLPSLVEEVKQSAVQCKSVIDGLGPERESIQDKRLFLHRKMEQLQQLIKSALKGQYDEDGGFFDDSKEKRLRDSVRICSSAFKAEIRSSGQQYHVHEESVWGSARMRNVNLDNADPRCEPSFSAPYTPGGVLLASIEKKSVNITLQRYCEILAGKLKLEKGVAPENLLTWQNVQTIFRQQSVFWEPMTMSYVDECRQTVRRFLTLAVAHVAAGNNNLEQCLLRDLVHPELVQRRSALEAKVSELAWPYKHSHPFWEGEDEKGGAMLPVSTISAEERLASDIGIESYATLARKAGWDRKDWVHAASALDASMSYYKLALTTFAENVPLLATERWLLFELDKLSATEKLVNMDDSKVTEMASESDEVRAIRKTAMEQLSGIERFLSRWEMLSQSRSVFASTTKPSPPSGKAQQKATVPRIKSRQRRGDQGQVVEDDNATPRRATRSSISQSGAFPIRSPIPANEPFDVSLRNSLTEVGTSHLESSAPSRSTRRRSGNNVLAATAQS